MAPLGLTRERYISHWATKFDQDSNPGCQHREALINYATQLPCAARCEVIVIRDTCTLGRKVCIESESNNTSKINSHENVNKTTVTCKNDTELRLITGGVNNVLVKVEARLA